MQNDDSEEVATLLLPIGFVTVLQELFLQWSAGSDYKWRLTCDEMIIECWNEQHGDEWMISQEDPSGLHNIKIMELWEKELKRMIALYQADLNERQEKRKNER